MKCTRPACAAAVRRDIHPEVCSLLSMEQKMRTVLCGLNGGRARSRSPKGTQLELALVGP